MEGELKRILKAWSAVILALCYCYAVRKRTRKGLKRFLCVLPVVVAFLLLPLCLRSVNAIGITSFFVAWLANSKLLLLAFDRGPLVEVSHLIRFVAVGCLPINIDQKSKLWKIQKGRNGKDLAAKATGKIHQKPNPKLKYKNIDGENEDSPFQNDGNKEDWTGKVHRKIDQNANARNQENPNAENTIKIHQNPNPKPEYRNTSGQNKKNPFQNIRNKDTLDAQSTRKIHKSTLNYALKGLLLGVTLHALEYTDCIHPTALFPMLSAHLYLSLEIIVAILRAMARVLLNLELEPLFDEPYISSSLQDFWGRRWNLTATAILRSTVYETVLGPLTRVMHPQHARISAVMATFTASGLIHELIIYYLGRVRPTWETTSFFVLQGICVAAEVAVKNKWRQLPRLIATPLTVAFLIATASWLFFPPLLRCNAFVRGFQEYAAVKTFLKDLALSFTF